MNFYLNYDLDGLEIILVPCESDEIFVVSVDVGKLNVYEKRDFITSIRLSLLDTFRHDAFGSIS